MQTYTVPKSPIWTTKLIGDRYLSAFPSVPSNLTTLLALDGPVPAYNGVGVLVEAFLMIVFVLLAVIARLVIRWPRGWGWDDYLIIPATVCLMEFICMCSFTDTSKITTIGYTIIQVLVVKVGCVGYHIIQCSIDEMDYSYYVSSHALYAIL
jgi:hypothetical protein